MSSRNEVSITVRARDTGVRKVFGGIVDSAKRMRASVTRDVQATSDQWQDASSDIDDASGRITRANEKTERSFSGIRAKLGDLASNMAKTLGKAASYGTAMGSVLTGPVVSGLLLATKSVIALGQSVGALAPLAAFLPSIAASVNVVKGTLLMAAPAMKKAFEPLTKQFMATDKETGKVAQTVQKFASAGLGDLAKSISRTNVPVIEKGMAGVAKNVNSVVRGIGAWVTSSEGLQLTKTIMESTDKASGVLAPKLTGVAIAIGRMANRAGDKAILGLANVLGKAADKATELIDSISREDIENALNKARDAGEGLFGKIVKIKDMIVWLAENKGMLTGISDALAVASIAVGAATGNWVAVIAGAATLILNHFDSIKRVGKSVWEELSNDPGLQMIWDAIVKIGRAIKEDFQAAFEQVRPHLVNFGNALKDAWDKAAPLIAGFLSNPNVVAGLKSIALGVAAAAAAFVALSAGTTLVAGTIIGALAGALAWLVGTFVNTVLSVVSNVIRAFGVMVEKIGDAMAKLPGKAGEIGRQMQKIGRDAQNAAGDVDRLRGRLNSLQSKTVTVTFGARLAPGSGDIFRAYGPGSGLGVLKRRTGGPVGARSRAATGGPRWGGVLVGEDGPEVVDLAPGSHVRSAAQTRGMMASGTGGGSQVVLEVVGGPTGSMEALFAEMIRRFVRVRGGNVQRVLGTGRA